MIRVPTAGRVRRIAPEPGARLLQADRGGDVRSSACLLTGLRGTVLVGELVDGDPAVPHAVIMAFARWAVSRADGPPESERHRPSRCGSFRTVSSPWSDHGPCPSRTALPSRTPPAIP